MSTENKKSPFADQKKRRIGFDNEIAQFRAITEEVDGQNVRRVRGYAILFDTPGRPWRGSKWIEKVDKKALEGVDLSNLVILLDHSTTWILGRAGKNLRTSVDETGLFVEVTLGDTTIDDFVFDRVHREILEGMSFWFDNNAMVASDWDNKIDVILKINEVYEVSIVTFPAYDETVVIAENVVEDPAIDLEEAKKAALINLIAQL